MDYSEILWKGHIWPLLWYKRINKRVICTLSKIWFFLKYAVFRVFSVFSTKPVHSLRKEGEISKNHILICFLLCVEVKNLLCSPIEKLSSPPEVIFTYRKVIFTYTKKLSSPARKVIFTATKSYLYRYEKDVKKCLSSWN